MHSAFPAFGEEVKAKNGKIAERARARVGVTICEIPMHDDHVRAPSVRSKDDARQNRPAGCRHQRPRGRPDGEGRCADRDRGRDP